MNMFGCDFLVVDLITVTADEVYCVHERSVSCTVSGTLYVKLAEQTYRRSPSTKQRVNKSGKEVPNHVMIDKKKI